MSQPPPTQKPGDQCQENLGGCKVTSPTDEKDENADFSSIVQKKLEAIKVSEKKAIKAPCFACASGRISPSFKAAGYSPPRVPFGFILEPTVASKQSASSTQKDPSSSASPRRHLCQVEGCSLAQKAAAASQAMTDAAGNIEQVPTRSKTPTSPLNSCDKCGSQDQNGQKVATSEVQPVVTAFRPMPPAEDWAQLTKLRLAQEQSTSPTLQFPISPQTRQDSDEGERWSTRTNVVKTHHAPGQPCTILGMQSMRSQEPGRHESWATVVKTQQSPGSDGQVSTTTGIYGVVRQETASPETLVNLERSKLSPGSTVQPQEQVTMPDSFLEEWKAGTKKNVDQ